MIAPHLRRSPLVSRTWMCTRRAAPVALAVLCLVLPDGGIVAQSSASVPSGVLAPGSRVRVTEIEGRAPRIGTVHQLTNDSLVIVQRDTDQAAYSLADIARLEVSVRKRTNAIAGMLIGLLVGVTGGYVWGNSQDSDFLFSREETALYGATTLGVLGTIVGGITGLMWQSDVWQVVDMDNRSGRIQLRPMIGARHVGVGVRLQF